MVCGATSGADPPADLNRVFFLQLSVVGSTMGTRDQLERLAAFLEQTGRAAGRSTGRSRWRTPGTASPPWPRVTFSEKSSLPAE